MMPCQSKSGWSVRPLLEAALQSAAPGVAEAEQKSAADAEVTKLKSEVADLSTRADDLASALYAKQELENQLVDQNALLRAKASDDSTLAGLGQPSKSGGVPLKPLADLVKGMCTAGSYRSIFGAARLEHPASLTI